MKDKYGDFELVPLERCDKFYKQYFEHEDDMAYRYTECHNRSLLFTKEEIVNNPEVIYAK